MFNNLSTAFDRLSHDSEVRCIILSGAGDRAFTSGLDVSS
jgi:delta(3,5)-delta(2,4)-dienoyl-CoA isomerase